MEITLPMLQRMLDDAAERGATLALTKAGNIKPFINQSEAYRLYGRANVDNWIRKGLITPNKDNKSNNSQVRIDRIQIESVSKRNNRIR